MLLRLILALLVASFALPAAAAAPTCHDDATMHHGAPTTPAKALPAHVCIGCVPLADWNGARSVPRIVPALPARPTRVVGLDLGGTVAPALPPPRIA